MGTAAQHKAWFIVYCRGDPDRHRSSRIPFKTAAAHAGIGWFGKNDVIITERYGPRVRLSAILIDEIFACGQPITAGRCPDDCTKCIDICPCKALKNQQWTIEKDRSEIIDYQKCNRMRSAFIKKLGRKNACGLCLAACPFGRSVQKSRTDNG